MGEESLQSHQSQDVPGEIDSKSKSIILGDAVIDGFEDGFEDLPTIANGLFPQNNNSVYQSNPNKENGATIKVEEFPDPPPG